MSEQFRMQNCPVRTGFLMSASMAALLNAASAPEAHADDTDHPIFWVELGGQFERSDNSQALFAPSFFDGAPAHVLAPLVDAQKLPHYAIGAEGKLAFAPEDSDWVFSISARYGRSNATRQLHYQSHNERAPLTDGGRALIASGTLYKMGDAQGSLGATYLITDFQAGKDVGLGMFGHGSTSVLSAGIRFAQFTSNTNLTLHAVPAYISYPFGPAGKYHVRSRYFRSNTAVIHSRRSAKAVGPSLSWDASAPFVGNEQSMSVALDWGMNVGVLFGRQRAFVHHETQGQKFKGFLNNPKYSQHLYASHPPDQIRSRFITMPNIGGFAGLSFKYASAELDFGYRADFFFNAMDGGIDTRKNENVGFYGPFATISIGVGG